MTIVYRDVLEDLLFFYFIFSMQLGSGVFLGGRGVAHLCDTFGRRLVTSLYFFSTWVILAFFTCCFYSFSFFLLLSLLYLECALVWALSPMIGKGLLPSDSMCYYLDDPYFCQLLLCGMLTFLGRQLEALYLHITSRSPVLLLGCILVTYHS